MATIKVKITSEDGLHARPAGLIAKTAGQYKSDIQIQTATASKNAKSIMSIMGMGLKYNDEVTFSAQGDDAEASLQAIQKLFDTQFAVN